MKTSVRGEPAEPPARGLRLDPQAAAARIELRNPELKAILRPLLAEAQARTAGVPQGPLAGVPYVLKDVWDTQGIPTTGGSRRHAQRIPTTSSPVFRAIESTGAILLGKSNLSDLAFTPECASSVFGATSHPADLSRTSGGSSGGGAAAVADGMAAFDWGSDFGGSIRLPAAFCGVVGLRLSASQWPPVAHFPEIPEPLGLNGMGPIAATVSDAAVLVSALASLRTGAAKSFETRGVALVSPDAFSAGQWPSFLDEARAALAGCNVSIEDAVLPSPREIDRAFAGYLTTHLHQFFRGHAGSVVADCLRSLVNPNPQGPMHPQTARVLATLGVARMSVHSRPLKANRDVQRVRMAAAQHFARGFLLVSPTTTFSAPKHGQAVFAQGISAFVKLGNVIDATAIAIPFGTFPDGLPRSLQILGPPGSEAAVLALATQLEDG